MESRLWSVQHWSQLFARIYAAGRGAGLRWFAFSANHPYPIDLGFTSPSCGIVRQYATHASGARLHHEAHRRRHGDRWVWKALHAQRRRDVRPAIHRHPGQGRREVARRDNRAPSHRSRSHRVRIPRRRSRHPRRRRNPRPPPRKQLPRPTKRRPARPHSKRLFVYSFRFRLGVACHPFHDTDRRPRWIRDHRDLAAMTIFEGLHQHLAA